MGITACLLAFNETGAQLMYQGLCAESSIKPGKRKIRGVIDAFPVRQSVSGPRIGLISGGTKRRRDYSVQNTEYGV